MAREVELVIKAKDEASKLVDSITDSLKALTSVQDSVGKSAQKTGSLLEQLGSEFRDLNDEAKRLTSLGKVAQTLERADAAVKNIGNNVGDAASQLADLTKESQNAATAATKLRAALEAEESNQKSLKAARSAAKDELEAANRALREAEKNQRDLNKAVKNGAQSDTSVQLPFSNATAINAAKASQAQLRDDIARYAQDIKTSSAAIQQLKPQVTAAANEQTRLAKETAAVGKALDSELENLTRAKTETAGLQQTAGQASVALNGLAVTQDNVAKASGRVAAEMARVKTQIEAFSKAQTTTAATGDVSRQTQDTAARKAAIEQLRALRKELASAQSDAGRYSAAIKAAAVPTAELGTALGQAQVRAKTTAAEIDALTARLRASQAGVSGATTSFRQWSQSVSGVSTANQQVASSANQAVAAIRPLGSAAQAAGQGMNGAAQSGNTLRNSITGMANDSRKALSLLQRVRGEVLSLATAYFGLQAAISNIGGVVKAFQTLEAAQNRLGSVFNRDTGKVTQELDFLRRQADRLGIEFGVLSDQYSRFAISAQSANFSIAETRKVFLSVAEAGRVMKLSQDQLQGVFKALDQIMSKGSVQAEELRGQIGDRMSGAYQIFASAIGVTTSELDKMMKKGEVIANSSNLLKFAAELDKRFGSQLADSLRSTTSEIGRFSNNLFEAQLLVARGGFIDSFTNALRTMNAYFRSKDGQEFFLSLGAALGRFIDVLAQVPQYFGEIKLLIQAFVAFKVGQIVLGWAQNFQQFRLAVIGGAQALNTYGPPLQQFSGQQTALSRSLATSITQFNGWQTALSRGGAGLQKVGAVLTGLRGVVIGMTTLFRGLWAAIGGLPGLILTGVTVAIGQWMTSIDGATSAAAEHDRQMQIILAKYDEAKGKVIDWNKELKGLSATEIERNIGKLTDAFTGKLDDLKGQAENVRSVLKMIDNEMNSASKAEFIKASDAENAKKLVDALDGIGKNATAGDLQNLRATLDDIAQTTTNDALKNIAGELLEMLRASDDSGNSLESLADKIEQSQKNLALMRGEITASEAGLDDLSGASNKTAKSIDNGAEHAAKFTEAMNGLGKAIPTISEELKKLETIRGLDEQYRQAIRFARSMGAATEAYNRWQNGITAVTFGDVGNTAADAAVNIIKRFEGAWQSSPFVDSDGKLRIGFSSDTITRQNGNVQYGINPGDTVTLADSVRDLNRRIAEMITTIKGQIGEDRFNSFSAQQQGVLSSLAYNYGNLSKTGILDTIKTGTVEQIAEAIRGLGSQNGGINRGRRNQEASLFAQGGDDFAAAQKQLDIETKREEKAKEYNADLENRLSLQENENANSGRLTKEAFIQKQYEKEKLDAKKSGVDLDKDPARVERIKAAAAAEWELANAKRDQKTSTQEANVALQQAVALNQQRNALQQQLNAAIKGGDQAQALSLQQQLDGVNTKLQESIDKARTMWQAIGGPEADVALTKLDTLKVKAETAGNSMSFLGLSTQQVGQLAGSFADGLVGVFDSFAQAIANGENAVQALGKAFLQFAADFLRQIATMILKQMILNALQSFGIPGIGAAHTGGVVGSSLTGSGNMRKSVSPALFAGAMRYHTGGVAGLAPDEVPTILKQGEEVLTQDDPRHRKNGGMAPQSGAASGGEQAIRVINVLSDEVAEQMLNSATGERVFMAHAKKNAATLRQLVGR